MIEKSVNIILDCLFLKFLFDLYLVIIYISSHKLVEDIN